MRNNNDKNRRIKNVASNVTKSTATLREEYKLHHLFWIKFQLLHEMLTDSETPLEYKLNTVLLFICSQFI